MCGPGSGRALCRADSHPGGVALPSILFSVSWRNKVSFYAAAVVAGHHDHTAAAAADIAAAGIVATSIATTN